MGSWLQVLDESLEGVVEGAGERLDDRGDFALRRLVDRGSGGDRIGDREPQCGRRQNDDEHTDHSDEAEAEPGGGHRRTGSVYNRARSSATLTSGRPEVFRPTPQLTCRTTFPNWPLFSRRRCASPARSSGNPSSMTGVTRPSKSSCAAESSSAKRPM